MNRQNKPTPLQTAYPTVSNPLHTKEILKQRLFDRYDLEELFKVSRGTIYNWCRKGLFKTIPIGGRRYFDAEDIFAMLEERKQILLPEVKRKRKK